MTHAGTAPERREGRILGGRYRLVSRVDEGGAGEVWRGRDERLERDVAVKLLGHGADAAFRERFTDEARRAATISHPNVVTVFDQGQDGPDAYMVMEYVRGRTLREVAADRGPLTLQEATRIVAQVAEALDAAHAAGVVHCDVKPSNVTLDDRGTAKLADFGVARAARGAAEQELLGTPRYIAPERIEGKAPTPASDVYGLGLVAFELIAGRPHLEGLDTEELLRERLEGPPPSLRRARVGVPADVDVVVAKALARDPGRRYQGAGEFARDLLAAARGEHTQTMSVVPPAPRPLPRGGVRTPRLDSAAALLAVTLVVLAVVLLFMNFPTVTNTPDATPTAGASPAAATTPRVIGMELREGIAELQRAGYTREISWDFQRGGGRPCTIVSQDPEAGATIPSDREASLVYVLGNGCTEGIDDDD
ncbi:MAG: serine/threonine protein kinase [Candidatus Limnocylindria bacterium]